MRRDGKAVLLGNEAIGLGLLEGGCRFVSGYPGTPASEILPAMLKFSSLWDLGVYGEWSTNEKVAFDQAFAAAMVGKRAACCMKQVGLNVACDSLMSAAYMGVVGGFVVVSCDDPGPHSSQTEQDSRRMAWMAKVPVFDPSTPAEARLLAREALRLSERFRIPVMLRSVTRLSHGRQDMTFPRLRKGNSTPAIFQRDVTRWAATPRFRFVLHRELNEKLQAISQRSEQSVRLFFENGGRASRLGVIATGVPFQMVHEILLEQGMGHVPVLKLDMPHPFPVQSVQAMMARCHHLLVLEEPDAFVEFLLPRRERVMGRGSGHVPSEGELLPEVIWDILDGALRESGRKGLPRNAPAPSLEPVIQGAQLPQRRPTLCAGCPHRASFYAIKRAFPKAVFTSDIGCYTLGANLGGVDTVLDMGSGITLASGLFQAFHQDGTGQPIIATMGDSTFYHSGTAALINAVYNRARFVLVLLDNGVTAMTGMQPTPGWDWRVNDTPGTAVPLERVVAGCGVDFIEVHDPYDVKGLIKLLKRAQAHALSPEGGVAVVIARHPCMIEKRRKQKAEPARFHVNEKCEGCRHCLEAFECPALLWDPGKEAVRIESTLCAGCGVCLFVCPRRAIQEVGAKEKRT